MFSKREKKEYNSNKKNKKPSFWEWLIHGKGTVAEPWPTAEELWNDPKVKKIIDAHNKSVKQREEIYFRKKCMKWKI